MKQSRVEEILKDGILRSYSSEKIDKLIRVYSEFDDEESVNFVKALEIVKNEKS